MNLDGEEQLIEEIARMSREEPAPGFVVSMLEELRSEGVDWDHAWYKAMFLLQPERGAAEEVQYEVGTLRETLHELKPQLRAAYEGTPVRTDEANRAAIKAERRLDRLTLSGPRHARARRDESQLSF